MSGLIVVSDSVPNWSVLLIVRRVCAGDWRNEYAARWVVSSVTGEPFLLAGVQSCRARSEDALTLPSKSSASVTVGLVVNVGAFTL